MVLVQGVMKLQSRCRQGLLSSGIRESSSMFPVAVSRMPPHRSLSIGQHECLYSTVTGLALSR